ncbi:unnamed protein product [Paramecium sonneborni]|uniref:Uncharacterized protein n=1 Tax=Paramecium sonneborni TaxID=65129 RepID=A0A8S1RJJ5_9CILI|nr:unnamed protein product [Paramecium sonneborni]
MNTKTISTRQPLSQIDFNQDLDNFRTTPKHKQFKTAITLNSDYKNNQIYNVQFKVKQQNQTIDQSTNNNINNNNASRLNENNAIFMSPAPLRRNTQFQIQQQQQQQITSPLQKNYSQKHFQANSPITKPNIQFRGISQQPINQNVSHTTTQKLQSDVEILKNQNHALQQQIFQLESNIQRGNSTQFIKELENKIQMLQKLNEKLNQDNQQLLKISNVEQLTQERDLQSKKLQELESQYENLLKQFEQFDCKKWKELEQMNQENKIEKLVMDLEDKITGLIIENEKLNQQIQEEMKLDQKVEQLQLELQQQQIAYQKLKHEEVQYRFRYDTANYDEKVSRREKPNDNKEKVIENIKILEEENIKLRELLREIDYDEEIKDLEDRIRVIAQDNRKLEMQLLHK